MAISESFFTFLMMLQIAQSRAEYAIERVYEEWFDYGGES